MAVEVDAHEYKFRTPKVVKGKGRRVVDRLLPDFEDPGPGKQLRGKKASNRQRGKNAVLPPPRSLENNPCVPFLYNPLHDMESLWWLANFLAFTGRLKVRGSKVPAITDAERKAQDRLAYNLFCSPKLRLSTFFALSEGLTPYLVPLHYQVAEIGEELELMREHLLSAFRAAEKGLKKPVPFSAALQLYPQFASSFREIIGNLADDDIYVSAETRELKDALQKKNRGTRSANVEAAQIVDETTPIVEDDRDAHRTKRMKTENKTRSSTHQQPAGPSRRSQRLRVKKTPHT